MFLSNLNIPSFDISFDPCADSKTNEQIPCRDPFIMLVGDTYYLYKSQMSELWQTDGNDSKNVNVLCYKSKDLENWCDVVTVLKGNDIDHAVKDMFWAPECHYYNGSFYLFTSVFSSLTNHRSISVYKSDSPEGPFTDITGGCITPKDWDAIDGTLYVDEQGVPYMVFVHEWTSFPSRNGAMSYARLSDDFTHFVTEPVDLFRAKDPQWAVKGVTDGPYMYRNDSGELMMIWSNFVQNGYAIALAQSESGKIDGPWKHCAKPIYENGCLSDLKYDGGHAMLFKDKNGEMRIAFHSPNHKSDDGQFERMVIRKVIEKDGALQII